MTFYVVGVEFLFQIEILIKKLLFYVYSLKAAREEPKGVQTIKHRHRIEATVLLLI